MTWTCIHSTFLPGQAEDSFPTFCLATELSALAKSKIMPEKYLSQGSLTEAYLDSLFGTMSAHSDMTTPPQEPISSGSGRCQEALLSPGASRNYARTSAWPEKAQGSAGNGQGFGRKCTGSLAKYNPDSRTWKTAQQSLIADWDECLETWPTSGMTAGMEFFQLPPLEQSIYDNAGGALPNGETFATPTTMDRLPPKSEKALLREMTVARPGRSKPANLRDQVSNMDNWKVWPTPTATQHKGWSKNHNRANSNDRLDYKIEREANEDNLAGRLSPDWVEWLMLWPVGWTALEPLPADAWTYMQPHDEPDDLPRVTTNCPSRAARLKAIGNGQVPLCAATALLLLNRSFYL
jgi:hypothetical protein